jgi:hypothetical protein
MSYLVCNSCGSHYELQEGEYPEDFEEICDCGGRYVLVESLDDISEIDSQKKDSSFLPSLFSSFPKKVLFLGIVVFCIFAVGIFAFGSSTHHFENSQISFNYPGNWTEDSDLLTSEICYMESQYEYMDGAKPFFKVQTMELSPGTSIESFYESQMQDRYVSDSQWVLLSKTQTTVDGLTAYEYLEVANGLSYKTRTLIVEKNGIVYGLIFAAPMDQFEAENSNFNLILDSFHIK